MLLNHRKFDRIREVSSEKSSSEKGSSNNATPLI